MDFKYILVVVFSIHLDIKNVFKVLEVTTGDLAGFLVLIAGIGKFSSKFSDPGLRAVRLKT